MRRANGSAVLHKVFYRPIEAAVRWGGLVRSEAHILAVIGDRRMPEAYEFPRWPQLRLNVERIFDAMANRELPYGKAGLTCDDPSLIDDPGVTVRHVDLKAWMSRYYPDQKPAFLFDFAERSLHSGFNIEVAQILMMDREALKIQLAEREKAFALVEAQCRQLIDASKAQRIRGEHGEPGPRSEATYLSIVGGLLTLLLGKSPSGMPYSSFQTTESVISALLAHHGNRPGISERTLSSKFAAAKRHIASSEG
jgi:hypothetical protein